MAKAGHIARVAALGAALAAAAWALPRVWAKCAYGTLRARLRCGSVLSFETSGERRTWNGKSVFCGFCEGRPYLLVGDAPDDLLALPVGDGGRPAFRGQCGDVFTLDCGGRAKTVTLVGDQCRVEER